MAEVTILEPISTGDVIDRAVRLYRRNFTPLMFIAAIPSLIYYFVSLMFWFGLAEMEKAQVGLFPTAGLLFFIIGAAGYPVWFFTLLTTVAGLSRVVGDHVMLSEPITVRGFFGAIRRRLGDIVLMCFLSIAVIVALYIVLSLVVFALIVLFAVLAGAWAALSLPTWLGGTATAILVVAAVAAGVTAALWLMSRIVFMPQILMIEGQGAGNALGRAFRLGRGNWYRLGAIVLFAYFVTLSVLFALLMPFLLIQSLTSGLSEGFFMGPTWNLVSSAFNQISNLLVLPIWIVAITLLYFDSRVRREAYDVELLVREVEPGFYWDPGTAGSVPGYSTGQRGYVQTSPLGLAGPVPPRRAPIVDDAPAELGDTGAAGESRCARCGESLMPEASFCMRCGATINS